MWIALPSIVVLCALIQGQTYSQQPGGALKIVEFLNQQRIEQNNLIEPRIIADPPRAADLHEYIWSLLWLRARFVRGGDRHFERIPEISFKFEDNYYESRMESWYAVYPSIQTKYVNVTINIHTTTDLINGLREAAEEQEQQLQQQLLQQEEDQLKDGQGIVGLAKVVYKYFLEGRYTCKDPQSSPYKDKCEYWQYYLESIIVRITRHILS